MSAPALHQIEITAPAKVNLGLEVLGRREDGFHEIATIFLAIDLIDHLRLAPHDGLELRCGMHALPGPDNLAFKALQLLRTTAATEQGATLELTKRIPVAAGLGGASSDAAAALLAGRDLWNLPLSDAMLRPVAARLGSDVPFFLAGGCALGSGRGEVLKALPVPNGLSFVIVVPETAIPSKTATLYANLTNGDFSDGGRVLAQAHRIASGLPLDPALLGNAFSRALYDLAPQLATIPDVMRRAGAEMVAITGAGPSHFSPFTTRAEADATAARLRGVLDLPAQVFVAQPQAERPSDSSPL